VRHIVSAFQTAPAATALIQGLWYNAEAVYTSTDELNKAFSKGDENVVSVKTEEIINEIVGNANKSQYKDWNGDGIVNDASDKFGLLHNGDPGYTDQGYIAQTIAHANFAAQATDSTENIKINSTQVIVCADNMTDWTNQLLEKALQLQKMSFGSDMEPLIKEMTALSTKVVSGVDTNGNGVIEPIVGEGGADTAYQYAYYMAEMPLLPGAHRIPPPAATQVNK